MDIYFFIVFCIRLKFPKFPKYLLQMIFVLCGHAGVISRILGLKKPIYNRNILFDVACEKKRDDILSVLKNQISKKKLTQYYIDTWQLKNINIETANQEVLIEILYNSIVMCDKNVFDKIITSPYINADVTDHIIKFYDYKYEPCHQYFLEKLPAFNKNLRHIKISKKTKDEDFIRFLYHPNKISYEVGNAIIYNNLIEKFPIRDLSVFYGMILRCKRFNLFDGIANVLLNFRIDIYPFLKYPDPYCADWIARWRSADPLNNISYLKKLVVYDMDLFHKEASIMNKEEVFAILCATKAPINIVKMYRSDNASAYMHYILFTDNLEEFIIEYRAHKDIDDMIHKAIMSEAMPKKIIKYYYADHIVSHMTIAQIVLEKRFDTLGFLSSIINAEFFLLCARYGNLSAFKKYFPAEKNSLTGDCKKLLKYLQNNKLIEFIDFLEKI